MGLISRPQHSNCRPRKENWEERSVSAKMAVWVGRQCGVTRVEGRSAPELRRTRFLVSAHLPCYQLRMRTVGEWHAIAQYCQIEIASSNKDREKQLQRHLYNYYKCTSRVMEFKFRTEGSNPLKIKVASLTSLDMFSRDFFGKVKRVKCLSLER